MTSATKQVLRVRIDERSRIRAQRELAAFGFNSCDRCPTALVPKPGRRFCCEGCRKRWADKESRVGRIRRQKLKQLQNARRAA